MEPVIGVVVDIGIVVLVIAVIREVVCWYLKLNAILVVLIEIRDLLKKQSAKTSIPAQRTEPTL